MIESDARYPLLLAVHQCTKDLGASIYRGKFEAYLSHEMVEIFAGSYERWSFSELSKTR